MGSDATSHLYWIRGKRLHIWFLPREYHVIHWSRQLRVPYIMGAAQPDHPGSTGG
jgi:hypothetical protein